MLNWYVKLNMSGFSERLKLLRKSRHMSQARLAELLTIDPRSYNRWERAGNAPHLDTLIRIADILQVTIDELVGRKKTSAEIKIRNQELHTLCQQADNLPDEEQRALILVMDGLITKAQMAKVMGNAAKG